MPTPPTGPLAGLHDTQQHLLLAATALASARPALTGSRQARAVELAARLDGLISYCKRLTVLVEADTRAEVAR